MSANQAAWLEDISRELADNGDPWGALNSQITADLLRLTDALIRLGEEANGDINNFAVPPTRGVTDCQELLRAHRDEVLQLLPERIHAQVLNDFSSTEHLAGLRAHGATEVFVDLNFSSRVGSPDVHAAEATAYAEHVLDALAPARL